MSFRSLLVSDWPVPKWCSAYHPISVLKECVSYRAPRSRARYSIFVLFSSFTSRATWNWSASSRKRVMEVLDTKEYAENYRQRYNTLFAEIRDGAEHCNNVSSLRSFADKAEALKIRLLNEMDNRDDQIARAKAEEARRAAEEAARKAKEQGKPVDHVAEPPAKYHTKKTKNVTIKNMTHTSSWRLESTEDVEKVLDSLRRSLLEELKENDIVNVEF